MAWCAKRIGVKKMTVISRASLLHIHPRRLNRDPSLFDARELLRMYFVDRGPRRSLNITASGSGVPGAPQISHYFRTNRIKSGAAMQQLPSQYGVPFTQ
jgi:hypothetical protein